MRNRKILLATTGLSKGGAETQVVNLSIGLRKRGWDVLIVSMLPPQAFREELEVAGIPVVTLDMRRGVPDPRAVFKLCRIFRQWKPQVVHSHMVHANLLARVTRVFCDVPIIVSTAHSTYEGGRLREIAYRLTDPLADLTTNVSRAAVARYIRVGVAPQDKIIYIPNGIDVNRFQLMHEARSWLRKELGLTDKFVWLAVGRFETAKDYPNLLHALQHVTAQCSDVKLLIAGQGTLFEHIKNMADALDLDENVVFLGLRNDIPELMSAADAYVMSSAWEGLPMVLLEAAACELPIVATDVGGNSEVVTDGRNGYLVPPHDHNALSAAMFRIMSLSEGERRSMGRVGRKYVEETYSMDRIVKLWEKVYVDLLQRRECNR